MVMTQAERRTEASESRLRLQTAVRLRWFGVIGQLVTVCFVYLALGFPLPFGICLAFIALSAWLNVFLRILYPARTRLSTALATCLLAYDILQLSALLYLTGGIENPFTFLLVAPVTVSAATLPPVNTIALGLLGATATVLLAFYRYHLAGPWRWIYIAGAAFALYLNSVVGVVQAFQKLSFLKPLAPTQSSRPKLRR